MHKICAIIVLVALAARNEGASQGKWSRPIRNTESDYIRQRRQFPYGEWIPLTKPCPTCRPLVDPLDVGQRQDTLHDTAGLVPPRPPTVTRQIHGEGNFFAQDDSAVLSVPPPPPSLSRHPGGNFQFQSLPPFNSPLSLPTQQIFPQNQPVQFLHQPFLSNQNLLVNSNQPILPVLPSSSSGSVFGSESHGGQFVRNEKLPNFDPSFSQQKFTENVILEQNVRGLGGPSSSVFTSKPTPFAKSPQNLLQSNSPQSFSQQQTLIQQNSPQTFTQHQQTVIHQQHPRPQSSQQHNAIKIDDSILTPPPQPVVNGTAQNLVLPGPEKEEIQLLYVPVETLRQRGNLQQQYLLQQQPQQIHQSRHQQTQNVQLQNGPNSVTRISSTIRPTEPTPTASPQTTKHFVTENGITGGQTLSSIKLSSSHPFSTASTPTTVLFQNLRSQQTPHPFVSATPISSTEPTFITPSPFTQKLVSITPETGLPHLATVQSTIPFSTPQIQYVTTPKNVLSEENLSEEIITGKPQFESLEAQKYPQPFAYQSFQQGNVHLQSFTGHTRPTPSTQFYQEQNREKQADIRSKKIENQQQFKSLKPTDETRYPQQQQVQENELREQYLVKQRQQNDFETQRLIQQQQRQNELEEQRILQKQKKQNELEEQRKIEHEQTRQREIEQERLLQQQRQSELEKQRRLQQQRQNELEEQSRIQRLRDAEEKRLSQQKQRHEDSRDRLRWQQQHHDKFSQESNYQSQEKPQKQDSLNKPQFYHQRQQQQILQQVHQVQQQQQQQQQHLQQGNKNIFSEADNANFISQAEQESETETENPQLVPHQPPLSVFYKGYGKTEPRITDVLKELRNSRSITVLDQYFEKMPKVFVGPAGLVPPTGYDKYELPYLSNIENRLAENQKEKLPFFVAPLNFVPPSGYSKIPFPSPHVGSVVISSDSVPAATAKPSETETSSSEEDDEHSGTYPLVGPELPGLINGLETEKNTVRTTTPSLPQTTAQLRNRRPSTNLYRQRKPVSRTRVTTTSSTTTTPRPDITDQKFVDSDSGLRKPFNRFLKRRRQPIKSTTENTVPEYSTEKKPLQSRYYSSQNKKQLSDLTTGNRKYGNQNVEKPISQNEFQARPTSSTYRLTAASKDRNQKTTDESDNSLQSEEEGPYPTGSAKTITHQIYKPNDAKSKEINSYLDDGTPVKLEPKVDTSTAANNLYDAPQPTQYSEESEVNPTIGYVKSSNDKSVEASEYATFQAGADSQYTPFPASLKYFDSTETPLPLVSVQAFEAPHQQPVHPTTEYIALNDRYTSAFAEISKHHNIPGSHQTKSSEEQSNLGLSIELQAPFLDSFSQERQSPSFSSEDIVKPTQTVQYSGEYGSSSLSSDEFSGSLEKSTKIGSQFDFRPTVPGPVTTHYTGAFAETTTNSVKKLSEASPLSTTELTNYEKGSSTPAVAVYSYQQSSSDFSDRLTEKIPSNDWSKGIDDVIPTTLNYFSEIVTESTPQNSPQTEEVVSYQQLTESDGTVKKSPNPSVVKVKSRVRGKQRGQVNYFGSQTTGSSPFSIRSKSETKNIDNVDNDESGKSEYQQNVSKYNFRGLKKPVRPTTETTTEKDLKSHVFTVKPFRRPTNPSTVTTKRIRKPTTPLPTEESSYESNAYTPELEFPSSGVSNDVYYENNNQTPGRSKHKKPYNSREPENSSTTVLRPTSQTYFEESPISQRDEYSKEDETSISDSASQEVPEVKPEWSSTESEVLTTVRSSVSEKETDSTEVKKGQDLKKASDPDLEKKNGRRRVRIRVNKRPHENFETAESQNLRTVANVLVPVTPAYKPTDDANLQLAKNSEFNYESGQKSFGFRSREYFRKRLNLTLSDVTPNQPSGDLNLVAVNESGKGISEKEHQFSGHKADDGKPFRGKFRGYIRKVIKHPVKKDGEPNSEPTTDFNEESFQQGRVQQGVFNHTGRFTGTRHKTFIRYIKKNKVKSQQVENLSEPTVNEEKQYQEEAKLKESEEPTAAFVEFKGTDTEMSQTTTIDYPETQPTEEPEVQTTNTFVGDSEENHQTEESSRLTTQLPDFFQTKESSSVKPSQQPLIGRGTTKLYPVPSQASKSTEEANGGQTTEVYSVKSTESRVGYKNKFFQTLRPVYSRAPNTGVLRIRDPPLSLSTEAPAEEKPEKKTRPAKYKYQGKFSSIGSSATNHEVDEKKEVSERPTFQPNKNTYTYDVRKYTRGGSKTREGGFGQFNRNRYTAFGKTEISTSTSKTDVNEANEETTNGDPEAGTTATEGEFESTTDFFKTTNSEEGVTTKQPTTYSDEAGKTSSSSSSSEENDEFFTTEKSETTVDGKIDISTLIYGTSGTYDFNHETTTEGSTETDSGLLSNESTERTTTSQIVNTQPDLYRFGKNSFSFDETEKFTGTKNRAYVRNITADILGLSAPGTDRKNEIIISSTGVESDSSVATTQTYETEVATSYDDKTDEPEVTEDLTETETTNSVPTTVETVSTVTDDTNAIEAKTGGKKVVVTVTGGVVGNDEESSKTKVSKLLKTSTQTKVSHETEICYRGKCIRTKSENPDEDLKLLVDSATSQAGKSKP